MPGAFVPGAPPLQVLQQAQAAHALAHSMGGLSVADGPRLPPCQPDDAVPQLEDIVASALKRTPPNLKASPGAAILVIAGGKTIVRHCWGQENVEAGRPVTEHTVFDLASLSKQFTALAVVRLVGEGRVSLSSPLSTYLSDFAPTPKSKATSGWRQVTVQHLLHHTSGASAAAHHMYMHMHCSSTRTHTHHPIDMCTCRLARLHAGGLGQRRRVPKSNT